MTHELKVWPKFFQPLIAGKKTFELREKDRKYQEGDELILQEFVPGFEIIDGKVQGEYTGSSAKATVLGLTDLDGAFRTEPGLILLSIRLDGFTIADKKDESEVQ